MGDQADKLRKLVGFFKTGEAAKSTCQKTQPPAASPSAPQSPSSVERRSTVRPWSASNSHHSKTVSTELDRDENATDDDWESLRTRIRARDAPASRAKHPLLVREYHPDHK